MKVLSLFDGISCGMVALERAGIPVERYVAYEIEENAIRISKKTIRKLSIAEMFPLPTLRSIVDLMQFLLDSRAKIFRLTRRTGRD